MSSSRAAVFSGTPGKIDLRDLARPIPRGTETLVRVLGCTLCGSDLHTFEGRRIAPIPTILGHEIVGTIVEFGDDSPRLDLAGVRLQIGDRVTWSIVANCGACFFCEHGLPQKCVRAVKYGHEAMRPGQELLGGLAEHCLLAAGTSIVRIPDELPLEVACPASCATATIVAALEAANDFAGATVCVLGAGLLGLTACAMALARGAAEVVCVEVQAGRRALAEQFGATHSVAPEEFAGCIDGLTDGRGVDVALELSGSPAAFELVWPLVRIGGTIVLVGSVFPSSPVSVALEQLVRRHLTLRGVHNYAPAHLLIAVDFLAKYHDQFPFAKLVAEWHELENVAWAFERAREPAHVRVGVQIGE